MTTATAGTRRTNGASRRAPTTPKKSLPPITVARFEEVTKLLERLIAEQSSVFTDAIGSYRSAHRDATSRPLSPDEAAQVAAALSDAMGADDPVGLAAQLQQSELRAYDEPDVREVLLAAGAATAPAFVQATRRVVALIEMPAADFERAFDDDELEDAIDAAAHALLKVELEEARDRAGKALEHFASKSGSPSGKGLSLLVDVTRSAFTQALQTWTNQKPAGGSSSLIGSPPSTDGPEPTSSTESL